MNRRTFAQLLSGLSLAAPAGAALIPPNEKNIGAPPVRTAFPVPPAPPLYPQPAPEPAELPLMLVYKPWALDQAAVDVICKTMGRRVIAVPTMDEKAPDIRIFDPGKSDMQGAIEAIEAAKADVFPKLTAPHARDMSEVAMALAMMVRERVRVELQPMTDSFLRHAPHGLKVGQSIHEYVGNRETVLHFSSPFNVGIELSSSDLHLTEMDELRGVYLQPIAQFLGDTINQVSEREGVSRWASGPPFVIEGLPWTMAVVEYGGLYLRLARHYEPHRDTNILRADLLFAAPGRQYVGGNGLALYFISPNYDWVPAGTVATASKSSTNWA